MDYSKLELTSQVANVKISCPYPMPKAPQGFCMIGADGKTVCVPGLANDQFVTGYDNILKSKFACGDVQPYDGAGCGVHEGFSNVCSTSQYICRDGTCAGSADACKPR